VLRPIALVTDPDKFAVGYMKVEKATANLALKVKLVEKSRDSGGDTPYREEYNGYLVRDSNCYFILCQGVNGMRISLFRRIEKKSGKESRIERLRGLTFGLAGSGLYGAAFVVEKSDEEESILEEEADIHNDIDHMIKGWLKRMKTDQFT
jgi:hypothetical protein